MTKWFVIASVAWPALLGVTVVQRASGRPAAWTAAVYLTASRICHQRVERSFATAGVQWPVCGRCAGLYLGAPIGALLGAAAARRRAQRPHAIVWLTVAGVPTALTLALEWSGAAPVTNVARAIAAAPLGAMIAYAIVDVLAGTARPIR